MADLMLQWKDPYEIYQDSHEGDTNLIGHEQQQLGREWRGKMSRCLVCGFETSIRD